MSLGYFEPLNGVTPFTYRDGESYLERLLRLHVWITEIKIIFEANLDKTREDVDGNLADFANSLTAFNNTLVTQLAAAVASANAAEDSAADALAVSELMVEAQDGAVSQLIEIGAQTRATLLDLLVKRTTEPTTASTISRLFTIDPYDTNVAPFEIVSKQFSNGGGKPANVGVWMGFNASRYLQQVGQNGESNRLGWHMGFESGYQNSDDNSFGPEWYLNYTSPDNTTVPVATFRPMYVRLGQGDTNSKTDKWAHVLMDIGPDSEGIFAVGAGGGLEAIPLSTAPLLQVTKLLTEINSEDTVVTGDFAIRPPTGQAISRIDGDIANLEFRVNSEYAGGFMVDNVNQIRIHDKVGEPVLVCDFGLNTNQRSIRPAGRLHVDSIIQAGVFSGTPTVSPGGLGVGAPALTINGNCARGTISFGSGATPEGGVLVEAILPTVYQTVPKVIISPANAATADLPYYAFAVTANSFRIGVKGATLPANQPANTFAFNYWIIG